MLGRVLGAYGVRGCLKIDPYTATPGALLEYDRWWVRTSGLAEWRECTPVAAKLHGDAVVAEVASIADRDAALALKGAEIGVPRSALPAVAEDEIYWTDLVGLSVVNREGKLLGEVRAVTAHAAHPLLQVVPEQGKPERLIPYVPAVIDGIDMTARRIDVDWGEDY